ncbi:hypothetical protein [Nocardioides dokdonensis]|nr:hypothetical protein [Nocardioides dokdonensis]
MARKFVSGINGKLDFDFACNRGHGFGEAHLHGLLIEIIASNINPRTHNILPSYPAPEIQRADAGAGRKREIDFAVVTRSDEPRPLLCVEAKWAGSSHARAENVLYDVARLALISQENPETECLFVLAGGKSAVAKLFETGVLAVHGSGASGRRLIRHPQRPGESTYYLRSGPGYTTTLPHAMQVKLAGKLPVVPARVRSKLYRPPHSGAPDWAVYVWRIAGRAR